MAVLLLTKLTLFSVLVKTRKCVTPSGPAAVTKSFKTFFFRTWRETQERKKQTMNKMSILPSYLTLNECTTE